MTPSGEPDANEMLRIAKDDALAWPKFIHCKYPEVVNEHFEGTIAPFVRKSIQVNETLLQVFNDRLGLPPNALRERHRAEELSGCSARCIRTPPIPNSPDKLALGPHTDFGSIVRIDPVFWCFNQCLFRS